MLVQEKLGDALGRDAMGQEMLEGEEIWPMVLGAETYQIQEDSELESTGQEVLGKGKLWQLVLAQGVKTCLIREGSGIASLFPAV